MRRFQNTDSDNRRLSTEGSLSAQSLFALRQSLEEKSAAYYKEVETLKLSFEREKDLLVQAVSATSRGCPHCPVLVQRIAELQNSITDLSGKMNFLVMELESLRASANLRLSGIAHHESTQYQQECVAFHGQRSPRHLPRN